MIITNFSTLFDQTSGLLPLVFMGGLLPFFSKKKKTTAIDRKTLATINFAVTKFLEARGVTNFNVYTLDHEGKPVVLIKAEPQKKLRFSNILEIQIKKFLREKLVIELPAVFWRFKVNYSETPGPEQSDYDYEEHPRYPQDQQQQASGDQTEASAQPEEEQEAEAYVLDELYNVHLATQSGMQVEEIPMGEFDEFIKEPLPQPETNNEHKGQ